MVSVVPALRHLRSVYPRARITFAAEFPAAELLQRCPYVDRIIDLEHPSELLLEPFDVAVLMESPDREAPAARALLDQMHAEARVAYRGNAQEPAHVIHPRVSERLGEAARMLHLAWLLGGEHPDPTLAMWPSPADRSAASGLVHGVSAPIALIHVGSSSVYWSAATVVRLVAVVRASGMHPMLVGSAIDHERAQEIMSQTPALVTDLTDQTSPAMLIALIERAALVIGPDSGPVALATALGISSVVASEGDQADGMTSVPSNVRRVGMMTDGEVGFEPALEWLLAEVGVTADRAVRSWNSSVLP